MRTTIAPGNFFVKLFEGEMFNEFIVTAKELFDTVKVVKPPGEPTKKFGNVPFGFRLEIKA